MKTGLKWGFLVVLPCYLLDQLSKWLICSHLKVGEGFTIVPGFFDIIHVRNTGAAFGLLQGIPESVRTLFFAVITVIAVVAIIVIFYQSRESTWFLKLVLCLVVAGALGNLTDRIIFSEVVDFINVHAGGYRWPTFNLADTYISLGMAGLILHTIITPSDKPE
ncbi:MAG: signal peptidase II [Thermodesulfobacteriota bacterium]|nr:signal peptidase II [Thermodesulfobacteriota bacterium]